MSRPGLPVQDSSVTITRIGGFRLVRKLGTGTRADVFLGHSESESRRLRSVAIKVCRPEADRLSIDREIAALEAATDEHCVRLIDLATDPIGRPALILERLRAVSLARLLADRAQLHPGECVTILAPLAITLESLHRAGITHGGIGLESIGFRDDGAPVVLGFGAAQQSAAPVTPASRVGDALVAADVDAFATTARAVLARVSRKGGPGVAGTGTAGLREWLDGPVERGGFLNSVADRLFDSAAARPVEFRASREVEAVDALPGRFVTAEPIEADEMASASSGAASSGLATVDSRATPAASRASAAFVSLHLPQWIEELVVDGLAGSRFTELWGRLRTGLRSVRKPVWVVAALVAAALLAALVVIPPDSPPASVAADTDVSPRTEVVELPTAVTGDDPLAALPELLEARRRCIASLSVLCLDAVDQAGSPALAADQSLIRVIQNGGELPETAESGESARVVERLGNSALIAFDGAESGGPNSGGTGGGGAEDDAPDSGGTEGDGSPETQPASILLMKGEAGWRIRAWLG